LTSGCSRYYSKFFFLKCAGELRINILRRKGGVETPGETLRGLYHALT